ncbi:MAG TPA: two-component regulator propeller domain-containing protein [Verrucomicrobiae bacterium]|jgi:signal transduction histidine kinase/ligand-binding sensor domain-containing protein|nr:two-component regulator propeller domain-containing protein [Verrucomicrobiae bacterium]
MVVSPTLAAGLLALALFPSAGATPRLLPEDLSIRTWTRQNGLPDDSVTALIQSRDGFLWVGTARGLARFDGVAFVPIPPPNRETRAALSVTALYEDARGCVWVGSQSNGLFRCDDRVLSAAPLPQRSITSIAEDAAGALWFGTSDGLDRWVDGHLTRYGTKDGLPSEFVSSVHVARSGTVWITTHGGMCQFIQGKIQPFHFQIDSPGRSPEALGVYEDRRGNLWAFGDTYLVNLTEGKHLNHFAGGEASSSLRIWSLCEGHGGELWIGTSGKGLYCYADDRFVPITLRNSLASDIRSLCEDREGNLWLGAYQGGLMRLQPRNARVLDATAGLSSQPPVCLASDQQRRMWIGFDQDGCYFGKGSQFEKLTDGGSDALSLISSICVSANSNVWIATPGEGLFRLDRARLLRYTTADGLADDAISAVAADQDGAIWASEAGGGLQRINDQDIKHFGEGDGLPARTAAALLPSRGGLWVGFVDGGVVREAAGSFRTIVTAGALGGRTVTALNEDGAGRLWVGAADGVFGCVDRERFQSWKLRASSEEASIIGILADEEAGLWLATERSIYHLAQAEVARLLAGQTTFRPQLVFSPEFDMGAPLRAGWPRAARSADGKLWFAMAAGVVTVDLRGAVYDAPPPQVLIDDISVDGAALTLGAVRELETNGHAPPIRLPSALRSLEIAFTAPSFSAPERVRFRYRLDGFDPEWVEAGASRTVHYGRLPYGTYRFRVQAGLPDQGWLGHNVEFRFLIPTPLWRRPWALALYVVVSAAAIAGAVRLLALRRLRSRLAALHAQQAMERERMRIAQDMHDEIGSKLTKISFMSERAKGELQGQDDVGRKLSSISNTSRELLQSLDEIVWAVNPRNDTLEHVVAYLGQYASEYLQNTSVECELKIPRGLPERTFSAEARHNIFLAFEEALNNALKHGRARRVSIEMRVSAGHIEIVLNDDGCGFDPALAGAVSGPGDRLGNGLRNMRQRLAALGGRCDIRSRPGQGTTVTLSIPLPPALNGGGR